jgi:transposase
MKFATSFDNAMKQMLHEIWHNHPIARCRKRAHAILLSANGYKIPQISQILEVERRAVSQWIDKWEALGVMGLYDKPRSGRPPIFTPSEATLLLDIVDEEPRQLKQAQVKIEKITGKSASGYTLKRLLKKPNMCGNVVDAH